MSICDLANEQSKQMTASTVTVYQKPTCSKCCAVGEILSAAGLMYHSIDYYVARFTPETLKSVLQKLGVSAHAIVRWDEPIVQKIGLVNEAEEAQIIAALCDNPDLVQRPIVVIGDKAIIARPPQKVKELLAMKQL